jgi:Multicopper oxidase
MLSQRGRPRPTDGGWKDTLDLGGGRVARVIVRFDGYKGHYVFHCHNLEHEDMAMANFEVIWGPPASASRLSSRSAATSRNQDAHRHIADPRSPSGCSARWITDGS